MKSKLLFAVVMIGVCCLFHMFLMPSAEADELEDSMITISRGAFMMGSPASENCREGDENQHSVTLSRGMNVHETEVTQELWIDVMGSNPSVNEGSQKPVDSSF